jgi:DNA processing protein
VSHPREALGPARDAGAAAASLGRLTALDPAWPRSLADLERPPAQLYFRGDTAALERSPELTVAIVGTREASGYGLRVARSLAKALAEAGAVVVSGLARGIDTAAHEGALEGGGKTIAVLGTGPDVPYPVGNRRLLETIARRGLVLSESPPGTKAKPGCFPNRNRIIAALAKATIVVEAGFQSGALNTATQADGLGRVFAAVPGPIDLPRSMGSNQLIRDGAQVIASTADALSLLGLTRTATARPELGDLEAEIWDVLGQGEVETDQLAILINTPLRELLGGLSRLEMLGLVRAKSDGKFARAAI